MKSAFHHINSTYSHIVFLYYVCTLKQLEVSSERMDFINGLLF